MNLTNSLPWILSLAASSALMAQSGRTPLQLSTPSTFASADPSVASDGDLSAVVYIQDGSAFCAVSDGLGKSWGAPVRLDSIRSDKTTFFQSSCKIHNGIIHTSWSDERAGAGTDDVFYSRSTDGGVTFSPELLIDDGFPVPGEGEVTTDDWRMVAEGSNVYFLFATESQLGLPDTEEQLFFTRSTDSGASFGAAVLLAGGTVNQDDVDGIGLAVDGSSVYVAWESNGLASAGDDVFFRASLDNGVTFGPTLQVDGSGLAGDSDSGEVAISADAGVVAIAYEEEPVPGGVEEYRLSVSVDGGLTFTSGILVGQYAAGVDDVDAADVLVLNGVVICSWDDDRGLAGDTVHVATSIDFGATFLPDVALSSGSSNFGRLSGSGSDLVVGFWAGDAPNVASAAISSDFGLTFTLLEGFASGDPADIDDVEVAYNAQLRNVVSVFTEDSSGVNDIYASGFKFASVSPIGWDNVFDPAETTLGFDLANFGDDAAAFVVLSFSEGPTPIGTSASICLGADFVGLFGDPLFLSPITGGAGQTLLVPNVFAGGTGFGVQIFYAAIGLDSSNDLGNITDNGSFTF